ncbi:MAG: hypothetical protein K6G48_06790 [Acholeplasmatales bacterium]|nr:hypothetical protein [Acholeplasmatales bacterium]
MKALRLTLGIISIVLFVLILFQSCAAGVVEAIEEDSESTASGSGVIVAILMLATGITAICTRKGVIGGYVCGILYLLAGAIGIAGHGMYEDLIIWSVLSLIFGVVFITTSIIMQIQNKRKN